MDARGRCRAYHVGAQPISYRRRVPHPRFLRVGIFVCPLWFSPAFVAGLQTGENQPPGAMRFERYSETPVWKVS
jgi:hypothetical protein